MTSTVELYDQTQHQCLQCGQTDNHPKVHVLAGRSMFDPTGLPNWVHIHHDCTEGSKWHDEWMNDGSGEGERFRAIADKANGGIRGSSLRSWIEEFIPIIGNGPRMITTGMDATSIGLVLLTALHIATGTATIGTRTVTGPTVIRCMSSIGADDAHAGTEITTGNSYTAAGTGLGAPTWATAANVSNLPTQAINATLTKTNMPARTIVALEEWDSSATQLRGFWGAVTSLTTNSGDSVALASSTGLVDTAQ